MLGQQKVDDKSNEITAIPKLLDLLEIAGAIVSIDAMGTQTKIAKKIRDKEADYILALKGNHSDLHDDIRLFLSAEVDKAHTDNQITDSYQSIDKGHGRIEQRTCYVSDQIDWPTAREKWCDLKSIIAVESQISVGEKTTCERRYFISSLSTNAQQIAQDIRSHWAIENSLHWVLDVTLNEDQSRVRRDHAPENMAMIRHMTLNMLRQAKKKIKDISIRGLQKKAAWGKSTLNNILATNF